MVSGSGGVVSLIAATFINGWLICWLLTAWGPRPACPCPSLSPAWVPVGLVGTVSLWWFFVCRWWGCHERGDEGNEDNHHRGCSRFHFPVTGSSITAPVITACPDGSWELLEVGSYPGSPLRVPQFPWMPSWVPWGGFWTSSHPGPKVVGVPVPVPCNMSALRHQLPGRTPWVGVWQGPPGPSLPPGAGAGPGRAGPGCCPPPEPPRRRWDPVGPVQRLGVGGWGHSPALALGPFQACGNRLGGAACVPPFPDTEDRARGTARGCPGAGGRPVNRASVSPWS